MKEYVRTHFPRAYGLARSAVCQVAVEWQVLRQVGPRTLLGHLLPPGDGWRAVLPLQAPSSFTIDGLTAGGPEELVDHLRSIGVPLAQGRHTIYLSPRSLARSPFRALAHAYPPDAALKIVKHRGGVDEGEYADPRGRGAIAQAILHGHGHLSLVANVLHAEGVGPRLYDLVELRVGDQAWTAYVVAHCSGREPTASDWAGGMESFHRLERNRVLKVTAPRGLGHKDFRFPDCNGNCVVDDGSGRFQFFDFQNFVLTDYTAYLTSLALEAASGSRGGSGGPPHAGQHLPESVPGLALPARRSTQTRVAELGRLMERARLHVRERVVLELGCGGGMMMGQYLRLGARWVHGWDMDGVAPHAQRLLWALGCTRFSFTERHAEGAPQTESDVPAFLRPSLDGCVVSCLAVRRRRGWLPALGRIPWAFMIYEGDEGETPAELERFAVELSRRARVRVAARATCREPGSGARPIALVVREP
jgi:hypothetical protein